jgi:hypothetical protein
MAALSDEVRHRTNKLLQIIYDPVQVETPITQTLGCGLSGDEPRIDAAMARRCSTAWSKWMNVPSCSC